MTHQTSSRDFELLSAYLDGQLSEKDSVRLESRIKADPELRSVYEGLRQTRALLRQVPARRAPRNFRLTPQMAGVKSSMPRSFPFFRFASVFASVLLLIGYAINLSASTASMAAPTMMAYDTHLAPVAPEMAAATDEPAPEATATAENALPKLAPSATEEAPAIQQNVAAPTATPEESMGAGSSAEMMPQADTAMAPGDTANRSMPQPPALPIHPGWLLGLLGLAVFSGASAFFTRIRAQQKKLTIKDMLLLALALMVAVLLAAGICSMFAQ